MNANGLWASYTLKPGDADNDKDGVPDGWELYVMFDPASGDPAADYAGGNVVSPFNYDDARAPAPAPGSQLTILQEFDGGRTPTDPWQISTAELKLDGLTDEHAYLFHLKTVEGQLADEDNDGLSNWAEYLASLLTGDLFEVDNPCSVEPNRLDYFVQFMQDGVTKYVGERVDVDGLGLIADHDFMEDRWEDAYDAAYVNRYAYDAIFDADGDGWSNWAEARVGSRPDKAATLALDDGTVPEYPIPAIRIRADYSGVANINAPIVVKAYSDAGSGSADATWTISSDNATTRQERLLGLNSSSEVSIGLGPGMVIPGSVWVDFRDPNEISYDPTTDSTVASNPSTSEWRNGMCETPITGDTQHAYLGASGNVFGRVDYEKGIATIRFDEVPRYLYHFNGLWSYDEQVESSSNAFVRADTTKSYVRVTWQSRFIAEEDGWSFMLSKADSGHVREGRNTFVAFCDLDGNGEYTAGEPLGIARDVNVGYDMVPELKIELRSEPPVAARFVVAPQTNAATRVRVVRTAINGVPLQKQRTVYARTFDLRSGKTFTEADLVKSSEWDFDWTRLVKDAFELAGIAAEKIQTADYEVYIGSETNALTSFSRSFGSDRSAPAATGACADNRYVVASAQPELTWRATEGYPAFAIQIASDEDFNEIVYATTNWMPAAAAEGCVYRPDAYVGEKLKNGTNYYWRVKQLNAKFRENDWSETAQFRTAIDSTNADTGYGRLNAEVRYFGPSPAKLANVVVGVYRTADFASAPVARKRLDSDTEPVSSLLGSANDPFLTVNANVTFDGIEPGDYYVMAFIDTNTNDVREAYESWGYANRIGTDAAGLYTPVAVTVASAKMEPPAALIVMEDTDVNQNWTPDCLEDMSGWRSPTDATPGADGDADGDGLKDLEEDEFGTYADNWDSDGDRMPDGWEAKFADLDPNFDDAAEAADGDVMAYAVTNLTVITTWDGADVFSATNKYVVTNRTYYVGSGTTNLSVGADASLLSGLRTVYDYGGKYGLGKAVDADLTGMKIYKVEDDAEVVLVHAQVYEAFGFDPTTANPTVMEQDGSNVVYGVNTKPFTALDKYLVCRYLEQAYGLDVNEAEMNVNGLWASYTLKPGDADSNKDGVPDGWELYVMFGTDLSAATLADVKISPFAEIGGVAAADYVRDVANTPAADSQLTILQEFDRGNTPTDPWQTATAELELDGLTDFDAYTFHLKSVDDQLADEDNDGLSNWAEYLASQLTGEPFSVDNPCSVNPNRLDYFYVLTTGDQAGWYVGECVDVTGGGLIADHDFMEDEWEDVASAMAPDGRFYVNRYAYDALRDGDNDGWSNYAEARAGTRPDRVATLGVENMTLKEYPVPLIELTIAYNGVKRIGDTPIILKAWHDRNLAGIPDAIWMTRQATGSGDGDSSSNDGTYYYHEQNEASTTALAGLSNSRYLGMWQNRNMKLYLSPGNLTPSRIKFKFMDIAYGIQTREDGYLVDKAIGNADTAQWITLVSDIARADDPTKGDLFFNYLPAPTDTRMGWYSGSNAAETSEAVKVSVGTVDYQTGEVNIDLGRVRNKHYEVVNRWNVGVYYYTTAHIVDPTASYIQVEYSAAVPEQAFPATFHLSTAEAAGEKSSGRVREGLNTLIAFADLNSDGEFDEGEPFGYIRDVNIGWDKVPRLMIELNESDAVSPRFYVPPQTNATTRVRVVRTAVNGIETRPRAVYSKTLDLTAGKMFTEADFIRAGEYDFDWKRLVSDAAEFARVSRDAIRTADYAVYVGSESTNAFTTFTRRFGGVESAPSPSGVYTNADYIVASAQPTFRWKATPGYPAFALQVAEDAEFSKLVYVTTNMMPAATADGCQFSPEIYVGDALEGGKTYYWRVAQLNSKFTENDWSETASFRTVLETDNANTGYGRLAAEVRYFGPADAVLSNVVVGVYETADFAAAPVARARLSGGDSVSTLTGTDGRPFIEVNTNICFHGIALGSYYVMAFIDSNTNGVRDAYESWGYANRIGTDSADKWTPVAFEVSSAKVDVPAALVVMEDTDVNQNWTPDCLEDMSNWKSAAEVLPGTTGDSDGDGLKDVDEDDYGTVVDNWDTDGDLMPDGWEALFAETDPVTPDGEDAVSGDVMAYAVTNLTVVAVWDGTDVASATNLYVVMDADAIVQDGDDASALTNLRTVYDYGGKYGLGREPEAAELAGKLIYTVEQNADVVLVHAQVYKAFGYSPLTANPAVAAEDAVNTKPFTALDKYLVCRYFEQV